jgi:hypothetical protein
MKESFRGLPVSGLMRYGVFASPSAKANSFPELHNGKGDPSHAWLHCDWQKTVNIGQSA